MIIEVRSLKSKVPLDPQQDTLVVPGIHNMIFKDNSKLSCEQCQVQNCIIISLLNGNQVSKLFTYPHSDSESLLEII